MKHAHQLTSWGASLALLCLSAAAEELPLAKLKLSGMITGWGTARANRSVDGNDLRIGGRKFDAGVGTHAASVMVVQPNGATRFQASVGVDDEVGEKGSVFKSDTNGKAWKAITY